MRAIALKEKLAHARDLCPGMDETDYQFAEYLAANLDEKSTPSGVVTTISLLMMDLARYRLDHSAVIISKGFPEYFRKNYSTAIGHAHLILQIIDIVADKDFAEDLRNKCFQTFRWTTARRVVVANRGDYPAYIEAAISWWAGAIQRQGRFLGDFVKLNVITKEFSEKELRIFSNTLAECILHEMRRHKGEIATLSIDDYPDQILCAAIKTIGISPACAMWMLPERTSMTVRPNSVTVFRNGSMKTIWNQESVASAEKQGSSPQASATDKKNEV